VFFIETIDGRSAEIVVLGNFDFAAPRSFKIYDKNAGIVFPEKQQKIDRQNILTQEKKGACKSNCVTGFKKFQEPYPETQS
jgi:hypothetical protein